MKKLYIIAFILFSASLALAQAPTAAWINPFGSTSDDMAQTVTTDPSGNVYVAGSFTGTVDFDPTAGSVQRTAVGAKVDGFIVKYNAAGTIQWAISFGGPDDDVVYGIAADATGVYVTGYYTNFADFDPTGTVVNRTAVGSLDIFLAKYSASTGQLVFVNSIGSTDNDVGTGIALDASSNIYITGGFRETADFDPSGTDEQIAWGGLDMYLAKYNSSGAYLWSVDLGSTSDDIGRAVYAVGADVWVVGAYQGTFYADPNDYSVYATNLGADDGYFGRYDASNGALEWGAYIRSTGNDVITSVWADATSLYTAGQYSGSATMYGDTGTSKTVNSNGLTDGFVARHTISDMKLAWINSIGGTGAEFVNWMVADAGSVYITGAYSGSMDVDPSAGTVILTPASMDYDLFVAKYNGAAGAYATSFSVGSTLHDEATSMVLNSGYLYLAGIFQGTVDLDPSGVTNSKTSAGGFDSFVTRFNPVEPAASPSALTFSGITAVSTGVSFTAAAGYPDGYLSIIRAGGAPTGTPVDGTTYANGVSLGNGTVLLTGPATSYNVVSLTSGTTYYISVYAYNGTGTSINYRLTGVLTNNFTTSTVATEPGASPTLFVGSAITTSSYTVTYTAAAGAPAGYIAVRAAGTAPTTDPFDGATYTVGASLGNGTVAYVGSGLTFNETGLTQATQYFYKIYSYNGSGSTINYRTTDFLTGNVTTAGSLEPTLNPTNLVFSSITSTAYNYNFTASAGSNVAGYVGIVKTGSAPTFVPTDGIALSANTTNSDGSVVEFVGTGTAWTVTGATAATTYYYAIYAYNGSAANVNYRQTSPLTGHVTTNDAPTDEIPPVIVNNTQATVAPGATVKITVSITDNVGVESAYVEFYPINTGESGYGYGDLVKGSGTTWEYTIPAQYSTEQGLEYNVYAYDLAGNSGGTGWKQVVVSHSGEGLVILSNVSGSTRNDYRIISVPLDLEKKSVNDVFSDDIGPLDKSKYRIFRYANGAVTELSSSSSIEIGKGYWFIASEGRNIDSGAGTTANAGTGKPFTIAITNGWNQIGNPFNANVPWSNVANDSDNDDVTMGPLRVFKGGFQNGTTLEKFSGGFVMVQDDGDGTLTIPVIINDRKAAPTPEDFARSLDSDTWAVDLSLKSGEFVNTFAGFGMHPKASELNDRYDDFTLPRFMDYLELNHNKKLFGSAFTKDIVPTSARYTWEFHVESNLPEELVELSWDNSFFGNSDRQLVLWDVDQQLAIDMGTHSRYSFRRGQSGTFKVFFGDENFVKTETQPYRPVFHSASPVPSSGNVTLAFSVPESYSRVNTNISIYNLMGQKVANLVDQPLPGGYQQAVWNIEAGTKPAAGMYISVLKYGDIILQKRLIIR